MLAKKLRGASPAALVGLCGAGVAIAVLIWAGWSGLVGAKGSKAPHWEAATFAQLAWVGLVGLVSSLVVQLRGVRGSGALLALLSVVGLVAFATGAALVGIAWAGERQNYWDAVHFASLLWLAIAGGGTALLASRQSAKSGSTWGRVMQAPSVVTVGLLVLAWMWTWFGPLQELQADIARYFFLALHG